jgi:uncharacterized protein DUF4386
VGLVPFGIHLVLLGYMIYRSGYIPRALGILLVIDGMGWLIDSLQPYLYPNAHLRSLFITFFGEVFSCCGSSLGAGKSKGRNEVLTWRLCPKGRIALSSTTNLGQIGNCR